MIPEHWRNFITHSDLVSCDFEVSEEEDLSGPGADMRIMSTEQCLSEATKCYPGIAALKEGYVPIAMCLVGSGDYYYRKIIEGENGSLYRAYHATLEGYKIANNGIEKVPNSYDYLLTSKSP